MRIFYKFVKIIIDNLIFIEEAISILLYYLNIILHKFNHLNNYSFFIFKQYILIKLF